MLVLYDLARALTGRFSLADAADIISKHLRRIVPASTCVFYVYDNDKDELSAAHASGRREPAHFAGLRIPGVSGSLAGLPRTSKLSSILIQFSILASQRAP